MSEPTTAPAGRKIIAPRPHPETEAFWAAANDGKLMLKRCCSCGKLHYYPRGVCPHCLSTDTEWVEAKGTGVIYSFSTMRIGPAPYTFGYVTLAEGLTVITNIVDCNPDALTVGQAVRVVFRPSDGGPMVPMFAPA